MGVVRIFILLNLQFHFIVMFYFSFCEGCVYTWFVLLWFWPTIWWYWCNG